MDAGGLQAALADAREGLRNLLAVVDEPAGAPARLAEAWSECSSRIGALEGVRERLDALPADEREPLESELRSLVRLHAVASDVIRRDAGRVKETLEAIADVRRRTRSRVGRGGATGGSVDVAG